MDKNVLGKFFGRISVALFWAFIMWFLADLGWLPLWYVLVLPAVLGVFEFREEIANGASALWHHFRPEKADWEY